MTPAVSSQTQLREGIAAAQSGNKVRARFIIRQAVTSDPENEIAWLWLANLSTDPLEGADCLRKVLALNPENKHAKGSLPNVLVRAGATAAQAGDPDKARTILHEALDLDPRNELGWLWLAGVATKPHDAIRYLTRVLEVNPQNERAKAGITHYKNELGNWSCPLCEGLSFGIDNGRCPTCKAVVSLEVPAQFDVPTGADETAMGQAIARLKPLAAKQPGGLSAFYLGLSYLNLGQPAEAINLFNAAAQRPEADAHWKAAINRLAQHWRSLNKAAAASSVHEFALPKLVMIVDDSPTVRKLVAVSLEPAGYRVVMVSSGLKLDSAIHDHGVPDLIILDINMPELDGFQVCKLLRKNKETAGVPVVFLTGKDGFFNKLRGQWAGAAEYLTKPFQPSALAETVTRILAAQNAGSESGAKA
ncbi:MAG: response regulator [Gemmataceae bacterium]